jgi:glycosyltransferase involved in cell wall biosynthesis
VYNLVKLAESSLSHKKNILVLSDWYLPAYKAGGPVRSIAALAKYLKDDFNFFILASNRDAFEEKPLPVETNKWLTLENGEHVCYLDGKITRDRIEQYGKERNYDHIYLNSFFSVPFSIDPLLLRKRNKLKSSIILAPRGMLGKGALSIKPFKKQLFIQISKLRGLHEDITWHATSSQEADEIRDVFGEEATITIIPNLVLPPMKARTDYSKQPGELKLCFISRISRKKNLDYALQVLQKIPAGKIVFDIYGPAEDPSYLKECKALIEDLPQYITATLKGDIPQHEVESILKNYHAFFLPTRNENFGHAIAEAILNGCIPLLSDQTPWRNLYESGLGWDAPLSDKQAFANAVNEMLTWDESQFKTQSVKIQEFAHNKTQDPQVIDRYRRLFK